MRADCPQRDGTSNDSRPARCGRSSTPIQPVPARALPRARVLADRRRQCSSARPPAAAGPAAARLTVSDTLVADNGGHGILVNPAGAANNVKVDLDHVAMRNNSQTGAFLSGAPGGMHASIADSVVSGSGIDGIQVSGFPNAAATAVVTRSVLSNNAQTAVVASDNAFIGVGQSMISGNVQTWAAGGVGKVWSFG